MTTRQQALRLVAQLLGEGTPPTPEKAADLARYTQNFDPKDWVVTISKNPGFPEADYMQIDMVRDAKNAVSTNPEDLRAYGVSVPDRSVFMAMPTGRYPLTQFLSAA
jgi:hypothetical protein